jgi:CDP-glucose 4,6-dehydratase
MELPERAMEGMEMKGRKLAEFFNGKRVLVTGHTGFKGSWLSLILRQFGSQVSGYSLAPDTKPSLYTALGLEKDVRSTIADIRDYQKLLSAFRKEKPEIVFHLAAQPLVRASYDDPLYTFSTNVMGTANVLECVRKTGSAKACVVVTTDKVYEVKDGSPHKETDELGGYDPYSSSKVCAEHVTRSYIRSYFNPESKTQNTEPKTLIASARAGNVIGGGDWSKDRIVPDIMRAVFERNEPVSIRNPSAIRPWQHVLDPLFGYLLLAMRLHGGERQAVGAWNFAPEKENFITVEELVKRSIKYLGKGSYSIKSKDERHETAILQLEATKARKMLGWVPLMGVSESIAETADWYRDFYLGKDMPATSERQLADFTKKCPYC